MSAIKDFFDADRADFISLRELLDVMCEREHCSSQEVALFLTRVINMLGDNLWSTYKPSSGVTRVGVLELSVTRLLLLNLCESAPSEDISRRAKRENAAGSITSRPQQGKSRPTPPVFEQLMIPPLHGTTLQVSGKARYCRCCKSTAYTFRSVQMFVVMLGLRPP
jgi:hypothetical protein